jgi:uncharacterized membrane protein
LFDSHFVYIASTTYACLLACKKDLQLNGFQDFLCIRCVSLVSCPLVFSLVIWLFNSRISYSHLSFDKDFTKRYTLTPMESSMRFALLSDSAWNATQRGT